MGDAISWSSSASTRRALSSHIRVNATKRTEPYRSVDGQVSLRVGTSVTYLLASDNVPRPPKEFVNRSISAHTRECRLYATKRGWRPRIRVAGGACQVAVRQSRPTLSSNLSR